MPCVGAERVLAGVRLTLSAVVLFPGVPRVVERVTEELDGQVVLRPAAVDSPSTRRAVGLGERKVGFLEALDEAAFKLAEEDLGIAEEDGAELDGARGVLLEQSLHHGRGGLVENTGLVAYAGEAVEAQAGSHVDEVPGKACDWDAVPGRGVVRTDRRRASCADSLYPALGARRDLRRRSLSIDEANEVCRREAAEQRPLTAGLYRSHVGRLDIRGSVAHAVDAWVLVEERAGPKPMIDLLLAKPRVEQLMARDDPLRGGRQPPDHPLHIPVLGPHGGPNPGT